MERKLKLTKRVLRNKAKEVKFDKPFQLQKLAVDMISFMVENKGIGLAAPQVGISKRLFVMYGEDLKDGFMYCFNPSIEEESDQCELGQEGCLSFPGEIIEVSRPYSIKVKFCDYLGNEKRMDLKGLSARCFMHELDHLDGITFHERENNV